MNTFKKTVIAIATISTIAVSAAGPAHAGSKWKKGLAAGVGKFTGIQQLFQCLCVHVVETDEPPLGGEMPGGGQPDTLRRTCDQYALHAAAFLRRIFAPPNVRE